MALEWQTKFRFPHGKSKALVMSYDDGSEHDRRLVDLFNRFGIRGTFHLNSGKLGDAHHVSAHEVASLYRGHEVSCHTLSHPDLTQQSSDEIRREILDDRRALEQLAAGPVRGLAFPFGKYDQRVVAMLPDLGIEYARTARSTNNFDIPENWLTWETTCHHNSAMDTGRLFLEMDDREMRLMSVWGHSYELDGFMAADESKNWGYMEQFCQLMHSRPQIHYAPAIEIVDYLNAIKLLRFSDKSRVVENTSRVSVWFNSRGATVAVPPGASFDLGS